ncbi:hypothetical protein TSAR_013837 [Trichomalopsis sarcophagae]|uniref:DUF4758 domain-containing protein n=1 Tax=Trichomalopsis sarcophagae TaxID=543379 RepID=A0A232ET70_9HYME|nr:hypothetical protein TSAR_013837 [Trichomalopsis sarcophagae]
MRLQLGSAIILLHICYALGTLASGATAEQYNKKQLDKPPIYGASIISSEARAARIAEFVSSHKIPDDVQDRKNAGLFDNYEDRGVQDLKVPSRAHVGHDNFASTSLFHDHQSSLRKSALQYYARDERDNTARDGNNILDGVRISYENPTTMLPILTTPRDARPYDFVPVNIIHQDAKVNPLSPFNNKNLKDLSDTSLIPAGSNTRIQVKKGPNGKDYEYEYVYYYYDEEDESKVGAGVTASNSQEAPTRTSAPNNPRRGVNSNRNKYSTLDRAITTTTVEPVINEVIPSGNGNRARQLEVAVGHEEVFDERLPTNTRFPPRARANYAAETTERTSRGRGNRQRTTGHETADLSRFSSVNNAHMLQEGPEFPQNLPNGPVRFLGVTPNEGNEDKAWTSTRNRGRPQRILEPAPVEEKYEEQQSLIRKRPIGGQYQSVDQYDGSQFQLHQNSEHKSVNNTSTLSINSNQTNIADDRDAFTEVIIDVTDNPTTQMPHAMDKVALDLYAFLQQGRSNLVDFIKEAEDSSDSTDSSSDVLTTEMPDTTFSATEPDDAVGPTTNTPATTMPTSTTSSTSTTTRVTASLHTSSHEPTSTLTPSRTKFRRPGVGSSAISRNRFKSHGGSSAVITTTQVAPTEIASQTPKFRGRFGTNIAPGTGGGGYKRARPLLDKSDSQPTSILLQETPLQKDSVEKLSLESKPSTGRGRYRGGSARSGSQARTTVAPSSDKQTSAIPDKLSILGGPASHRASSFNKLGSVNRRRGNRPTSPVSSAVTNEEAMVTEQTSTASSEQENISQDEVQQQANQSPIKLVIGSIRAKPLIKPYIKPGAGRLNLRPRPGQQTTTTTTETAVTAAETAADEPAGEGTEEETREAPAESSPVARLTTANPLNKLRNRNRIQIHPKMTTVRTPLPPASRRSHLLPRRKTTETPVVEPAESSTSTGALEELDDSTEGQPQLHQLLYTEAITVASSSTPKQDEIRGLSSLLAFRRRLTPRRPGQPIVSSTSSAE